MPKCAPWTARGDFDELWTATDGTEKGEAFGPVSYTHLDVYKRQIQAWGLQLHISY